MRRLLRIPRAGLTWLTVFLASAAGAAVLKVPGEHAGLAEAIRAALPGDEIRLAAGIYDGPFTIDKTLTLGPDGTGPVKVRARSATGPALLVRGAKEVRIENLVFEHHRVEERHNDPRRQDPALKVLSAAAFLKGCVVRGSGGDGLHVEGAEAAVFAEDCRFEENYWDGVFVVGPGARLEAAGCSMTANGDDGIHLFQSPGALLTRCALDGNRGHGIRADLEPRASPLMKGGLTLLEMKGGSASGNAGQGLDFRGGGGIRIEGTVFEGNEGSGLEIRGPGASAELEDCEMRENGRAGLVFSDAAAATARRVRILRNGRSGAVVKRFGTAVKFEDSLTSGNTASGLHVSFGASAEASGCAMEDNLDGARVFGQGTILRLADCRLLRNAGPGLTAAAEGEVSGSGIVLEGNGGPGLGLESGGRWAGEDAGLSFDGNSKGETGPAGLGLDPRPFEPGEIAWLLASGEFARLEALSGRIRETRARDGRGEWLLEAFYRDVAETSGYGDRRDELAGLAGKAVEWREANPRSAAARIALGVLHVETAWTWRGTGFAFTVDKRGWREFEASLARAREVLLEAQELEDRDPHAHAVMEKVLMGLGAPVSAGEANYRTGVEIEPAYHPLHLARAVRLLPRWSGRTGDVERFAAEAAAASARTEGEGVYARIALEVLHTSGPYEYEKSHRFAWPRIHAGFEDIRRRYGDDPVMREEHLLLACLHRDKAAAKTLFKEAVSGFDETFWRRAGAREAWRRWALENAPRPALLNPKPPAPARSLGLGAIFPSLLNPGLLALAAMTPILLIALLIYVRRGP